MVTYNLCTLVNMPQAKINRFMLPSITGWGELGNMQALLTLFIIFTHIADKK